ncbi:MAG: hypothetical protein K9J12_18615 [Melioribacteraceae bacterium]|nr:hypothetical protein [Melioribacteraceae bacterium]MCF8266241.1 hypothetical protein [Melioribacteraceae bacterium]
MTVTATFTKLVLEIQVAEIIDNDNVLEFVLVCVYGLCKVLGSCVTVIIPN